MMATEVPTPRIYVATNRDRTQTMCTIWPDGTVELAYRRNRYATWGLPLEMVSAEYAEEATG